MVLKRKVISNIDEMDTTVFNLKQLRNFCISVNEELQSVKRESRLLQLEKNELMALWQVASEQLTETRADVRNKERELELQEEKYVFKVRDMMNDMRSLYEGEVIENINTIAVFQTTLTSVQEVIGCKTIELINDIHNLKNAIFDKEVEHNRNLTPRDIKSVEEKSELLNDFQNISALKSIVHEKFIRCNIKQMRKQDLHTFQLSRKNRDEKRIEMRENSVNTFRHFHMYFKRIQDHHRRAFYKLSHDLFEIKKRTSYLYRCSKSEIETNEILIKETKYLYNILNDIVKKCSTLPLIPDINKSIKLAKVELQTLRQQLETLTYNKDVVEEGLRMVSETHQSKEQSQLERLMDFKFKISQETHYLEQIVKELEREIREKDHIIFALSCKDKPLCYKSHDHAKNRNMFYKTALTLAMIEEMEETVPLLMRKHHIHPTELGFRSNTAVGQMKLNCGMVKNRFYHKCD